MRIGITTAGIGCIIALAVSAGLPSHAALAQSGQAGLQSAASQSAASQSAAPQSVATDFSAQRRSTGRTTRRSPTRLRVHPLPNRVLPNRDGVYPHFDPGPNAVRDCTATYVQEFRPSGTVITPRMHCHWRRG
ncbi:MAG: hypothetical protein KDJ76_06350 [Xanthobacteraceae bacterium]|nr:hypothetical protein [Xanthobacteraceae bacterium]